MTTRTIILSIIILIHLVQSATVSHLLKWNGGHCTICTNTPLNNYACSNGHGNWNSGNKVFTNIIPPGNVVKDVKAIIYGLWECVPIPATVTISLQSHILETIAISGSPGCPCSSCDAPKTFDWPETGLCFPDYNYNGTNLVNIQVLETICVEAIEIILTYEPGSILSCGLFTPQCTGGCGLGTCVTDPLTLIAECICPQNYSGPNCQCMIPSYYLETDNPPVLDVIKSGFNAKDTLYLYVNNSVKYFNTSITFKNSLTHNCDYPFATGVAWNKYFDSTNCVYVLEGIIPWGIAWPECVFSRTEDPNWIIFTGEMIVENHEYVGELSIDREINITRTIVSRLPFQVRYPKSISINTNNITIFSQILVLASITEQKFTSEIPVLPGSAEITLLTSVQYPYQIIDPLIINGDLSRFSLSITGNTLNGGPDCLDSPTDSCEQLFTITIIPNTNECNFDGIYSFDFILGCKPSYSSNCPLNSNTNHGTIFFTLNSEDFCVDIVEDIDLTGTLMMYENPQHTIIKTNLVQEQYLYFVITTSSDKATIIGTHVNNIIGILWDSTTKQLYLNGFDTLLGTQASLVVNNVQADESWIELIAVSSIFPIPQDESKIVTFEIDVNVSYYNTNVKKRAINQQQKFIVNADLLMLQLTEVRTNASNLLIFATLVLLICVIF